MSSKLDYLQQKKLNPADELRELLSRLEERLVKIKGMTPTLTLILLRDLDQVFNLFELLEAAGLNLMAEEGRFNTVQARLMHSARPLLKSLGGPVALVEHRPSPLPPRERWWWYIDEPVAAQRQRLIRRLTIGGVIALLVVAGLVLAFNTILAPSPEVIARLEVENEIFNAIDAGDFQVALAAAEAGLSLIPGDPSLLLLKGVLQDTLDQETEAQRNFALVLAGLDNPQDFYLRRSQLELRVNQFQKAEEDARTALDIDDKSATAWLFLGQALESQDRGFEAIGAYEKAGELAFESGDNQIVVIARLALVRLGAGGISE